MDKYEKMGLFAGVSGATLGATLWLILLGVAISSSVLTLFPMVFGIVCVYGVIKLYNARPQRKLSITGLAVIWLILWNAILCNLYFDRIPEMIGNISTGKEQISLIQVNGMFVVFFLVGFGLILADIIWER